LKSWEFQGVAKLPRPPPTFIPLSFFVLKKWEEKRQKVHNKLIKGKGRRVTNG
jgi:hypothetical protein